MAKGDKRPVVMGEGIINDLTTGGASAALSAEMGKVLAQRPNPSLLINGYFLNPVNQRGQTEYLGTGYAIDGWRTKGANTKITLLSDGIQFGKGDTTGYAHFQQFMEGIPEGAALTASVIVDGNLYVKSVAPGWVYPTENDSALGYMYITVKTGTSVALNIVATTNNLVSLYFYFGGSIANEDAQTKLSAAKLELGSIQTLAHQDESGNWVLNEIPDYAEELAKCQWYSREMYVAMQGAQDAYGLIRQSVTFPSMRITPTATLSKSGGTEPNAEIALLNNGGFVLSAHGSEESFKSWYGRIFLDASL